MAAEAEAEALQAKVKDPQVMTDHRLFQATYTELHAAQQRVEELYARWEAREAKKKPQSDRRKSAN